MAPNPNPARISDMMWWFWEQFKVNVEPEVQLGGIYANKSGYHNTRNANNSNNYSVREAEDQQGPGDKAAAIDLTFPSAQRGDYRTIAKYCQRLMASGKDPDDPRLDNLREWYGQTDSDSYVEGWDCRHLHEITSDSSHLWHIHISFDRGKVNDGYTMRALLSVLRGQSLADWNREQAGPPAPPVVVPPQGLPGNEPGTRVLRLADPQMSGKDVLFVQRWIGQRYAGTPDGVFGPQTKAGVIWYQRMRGLSADGEVGPRTFQQMGVSWRG